MIYEYVANDDNVSILYGGKQVAKLRGKKARNFSKKMQKVQDTDAQSIMSKIVYSYEQRPKICKVSIVMFVFVCVCIYFGFRSMGLPNQTNIIPIGELSPEAVNNFEERLRELSELSPNYQHPSIAEVRLARGMLPDPTNLHHPQVRFNVLFDLPDFYGAFVSVNFFECSTEAREQLNHLVERGRSGGYRRQSFIEYDNDTSVVLFRVRYNTSLRVANIYFHETFSIIRIGNGLFQVGNSVNMPRLLNRTENFRRWDFTAMRENAVAASEVIEIISTVISYVPLVYDVEN